MPRLCRTAPAWGPRDPPPCGWQLPPGMPGTPHVPSQLWLLRGPLVLLGVHDRLTPHSHGRRVMLASVTAMLRLGLAPWALPKGSYQHPQPCPGVAQDPAPAASAGEGEGTRWSLWATGCGHLILATILTAPAQPQPALPGSAWLPGQARHRQSCHWGRPLGRLAARGTRTLAAGVSGCSGLCRGTRGSGIWGALGFGVHRSRVLGHGALWGHPAAGGQPLGWGCSLETAMNWDGCVQPVQYWYWCVQMG